MNKDNQLLLITKGFFFVDFSKKDLEEINIEIKNILGNKYDDEEKDIINNYKKIKKLEINPNNLIKLEKLTNLTKRFKNEN